MRYLVTGASGQLGREWTRFLNQAGEKFTAYSSGELDITDSERISQIVEQDRPDVVINCAAYTDVDEAESNPGAAFLVNEAGVKNLAKTCRQRDVKLVHYSTDYIFSGRKSDRKKYPDGYPEDAPAAPVNRYGESKRAGEVALEESGVAWLLIRVSWLCGRFGNNFVKTMLTLAEEREQLDIVDDQTGSPTYGFDVVEKTHRLLDAGQSGIYHISSAGSVTWAGFAEEIFRQAGKKVKIRRVSSQQFQRPAKRPNFSVLSTRKAEQAGLRAVHWKDGLKRLLQQTGGISPAQNRKV